MESTTTEAEQTNLNQNTNLKFDMQSLKIISSESFKIESCYKNINSLSKGKIIKSLKFQEKIESIIKKMINKNYSKKASISTISQKNKKEELFCGSSICNDIDIFSEGDLTPLGKKKYKDLVLDNNTNKSSNKIIFNTEKNVENFIINEGEKKYNKSSSKFLKKEKQNTMKNKNIFDKGKNEYIENNIPKWNFEGNYLNKIKKDKNNKKEVNNKNIISDTNKSFKSSLNAFNYNSTNENRLSILNTKNCNSSKKIIQVNNSKDEKTKKCILI